MKHLVKNVYKKILTNIVESILRIPMLASIVVFAGYYCLAMTYQGYFESKSVVICSFYMLLTGLGSALAYFASMGTVVSILQLNQTFLLIIILKYS
jgi:hypothetical protein